MTSRLPTPLLGTAASITRAELDLARDLDGLHQLIYVEGGVKPTNAAIEELSKLLFLKSISFNPNVASVFRSEIELLFSGALDGPSLVVNVKDAFRRALMDPVLALQHSDS